MVVKMLYKPILSIKESINYSHLDYYLGILKNTYI